MPAQNVNKIQRYRLGTLFGLPAPAPLLIALLGLKRRLFMPIRTVCPASLSLSLSLSNQFKKQSTVCGLLKGEEWSLKNSLQLLSASRPPLAAVRIDFGVRLALEECSIRILVEFDKLRLEPALEQCELCRSSKLWKQPEESRT